MRPGRDLEESLPYRNPGDAGVAKVPGGFLEVDCSRRDHARHDAIRETRHHVRFEGQRGNLFEDGGQHGGAGGVTTDANHNVSLEFRQYSARRDDGARKINQGLDPSREINILQGSDFDQLQAESGGGDEAVFDAACGADKQHFRPVSALEFLGDGERGNNVSSGASAGKNSSHAVNINDRETALWYRVRRIEGSD